jgi:hypothetical protein
MSRSQSSDEVPVVSFDPNVKDWIPTKPKPLAKMVATSEKPKKDWSH